MRQLKERHDAVERAIQSIERYRKSPATGTLSLSYIDQRKVWGHPLLREFYSNNIHSYELSLHKLRRFVTSRAGAGTLVQHRHLHLPAGF